MYRLTDHEQDRTHHEVDSVPQLIDVGCIGCKYHRSNTDIMFWLHSHNVNIVQHFCNRKEVVELVAREWRRFIS